MKTDKNSRTHSTTSGTPSQPELAVSDSNQRKQYEVQLHRNEYKYATLIIEADSSQQAENIAESIELAPSLWQCAGCETHVWSVEPVKGGKNNE